MTNESYCIIGMSPGNSYFKEDEIKYLLKTGVERYGRVAIMIADIPAISTYVAFGYAPNIARREKALPQGNLLKNRVRRAMAQLGYSDDQVRIINWGQEVEQNSGYQEAYKKVAVLYNQLDSFRADADDTTRAVIVGSGRLIPDIESATKTAVHYLLSEFAFLEWAPSFLSVSKVAYFYHKNWPVYENYIAGKYDDVSKLAMDFVLLENPWETYRSHWGGEDEEVVEYASALERVQATKTLRVAFTNYPPALVYDRVNDSFSGIFYDVIMSVARKYGWGVRWSEETGYGVIIDGLEHNRFDIFGSAVWPTPERRERASFSKSLYQSDAYPWMIPGFEYEKEKDSEALRIVVRENDISHSIALADFPKARLVFVPQLAEPSEVLAFVAEGKGDITFAEKTLVDEYMKTTGKTLVSATEKPVREYENTFIFKKEDPSLKNIFNAEIDAIIKK